MHSFVDAEAWTGRSSESVTLLPLALKFPAGVTAKLTAPVLCQPTATAGTQKQHHTAATAGVSRIRFPFFG
jgi:hypothetical protein